MTDIPEPLRSILDLARWAPSGDNEQPWRFEVIDPSRVIVHVYDTREHCVYDLQGSASRLAWGALLETMTIAASGFGRTAMAVLHEPPTGEPITLDVSFLDAPGILPSPLIAQIPTRTVHRRAMQMRNLTAGEKAALEASVAETCEVVWIEGIRGRWQAARLMFANAKLRLTMREAYETHRNVIDWGKRFSEDKVPDQALGLDPLTLKLMRWVLHSWGRVQFFNRWLAGTLAPRIQMDLYPSLACGAHFALIARKAPADTADYLAVGRVVQRFWLTATQLGLQMQPEMTPIIFSCYVSDSLRFTAQESIWQSAQSLARRLTALIGPGAQRAVFMGRIGAGPLAEARSIRRPLATLLRRP